MLVLSMGPLLLQTLVGLPIKNIKADDEEILELGTSKSAFF